MLKQKKAVLHSSPVCWAMLLREYAIKRWFLIPPLITNVSAYQVLVWDRRGHPVKTLMCAAAQCHGPEVLMTPRWCCKNWNVVETTLCLKKTTLMLHTITSVRINWFWYFLAGTLLKEYAIKWWFVMHYLEKHEHELQKLCLISHAVYHVSKTDIALACYIFDTHQSILIIFVDDKVVLLSTVCKYYFSPSHFVFWTRYTAWLKRHY